MPFTEQDKVTLSNIVEGFTLGGFKFQVQRVNDDAVA